MDETSKSPIVEQLEKRIELMGIEIEILKNSNNNNNKILYNNNSEIEYVTYNGHIDDDIIPRVLINPNFEIKELPESNTVKHLSLISYSFDTIPNYVNLVKLHLDGCHNFSIPDTLVNLKELKILRARENYEIPDTLVMLEKIQLRSFNNSGITIPDTLINLKSINYYSDMPLVLPSTLVNLRMLDYYSPGNLILHENFTNLAHIVFKGHNLIIPDTLTNITYLNFSSPSLDEPFIIPRTLKWLFYLKCGTKKAVELPDTLTNLIELELARYIFCPYGEDHKHLININIPDTFVELKELKLYGFIIDKLPNTFVNLKVLDIKQSRVLYIPEEYKKLRMLSFKKSIFHKVLNKCKYNSKAKSAKNMKELSSLYKTLVQIQKKIKWIQLKNKDKYLWNPLYMIGYYNKRQLTNMFH